MANQLFAKKSLKVLLAEMAGEHRLKRADRLEPMLCGEFAVLVRAAADRAGKAQLLALALNRLDEGLAPPAETNDGRLDHRPARRR